MASTGPSDKNAVRVINRNSCGSGSVVGLSDSGCYVLSNAHVTGTQIGRTVRIDTQANGQHSAKIIMAGYSDRIQMDWSVIHVDGFKEIQPVKLSKAKPNLGKSYYTKGSPRCVWPLKSTDIKPVDMSPNSALWRWRPNAIGGQSGSAVWSDDDNLQYGLLTWSWGGLGAGQQTAMIYQQYYQALHGLPVMGMPRWEGLIELPDNSFDGPTDLDDPTTEEGVFVQTNITTLPIWHDPTQPDPKPNDPAPGPGSDVRAWTIEHLRKQEEFYGSERRRLEESTSEPSEPNPDPAPDSGCVFGMPPLD